MPPTWKPEYKWRVVQRNGRLDYRYYKTRRRADREFERRKDTGGIVLLESGHTRDAWRAVRWNN